MESTSTIKHTYLPSTIVYRQWLPCSKKIFSPVTLIHTGCALLSIPYLGAQWLSGRVLDSRPKGRRFEPHRRHCIVSLSKNINPSLVLVQPRKTRPFITERLLMGRKESNQTNKFTLHFILTINVHFLLKWVNSQILRSSCFHSGLFVKD